MNRAKTKHAIALVFVFVAIVLPSCNKSTDNLSAQAPPVSWSRLSEDQLDPDATSQLALARKARDEMESKLKASLVASIEADAPHGAVGVCSTIAPAIASELSMKHGLEIGRTSFKLRNNSNQPPEWMAQVIDARDADPAYFASTDGSLGVTFPIMVAPPCLLCHGEKSSLTPQVQESIQTHYPDDQATGFALGDLRGWFWVTVPESD